MARGVVRNSYVQGASKLRRKLVAIEPEARRELRDVLKAAGEKVAQTARGLAPVDEGVIATSIKARIFAKGMQVRIGFFGQDKNRAWYAHFVEFGTRGGEFKTRRGKRRAKTGFTVTMPAKPAQPFMRPAAQKVLPEARRMVREAMLKMLQRVARRGN